MCGIAGFINAPGNREQQLAWIDAMGETIQHRGPDAQGVWIQSPVCLGHRRLSIIDLEGGNQPLVAQHGDAVIVFNGEIYNFAELREKLEKKGFVFRTRSDTEVLLNAYLADGLDCLNNLDGMFAFAIWDARERTLVAARDPMGKKPFYYVLKDGVFAFASELSAFRCLPFLNLGVDKGSIVRYLAYEYVPTPETIYRGVFKLRPGHFLTFSRGTVKTAPYWDLPVPRERSALSEQDCCETVRYLARRAVKKRLVSDVPLGVFLSGGIDSSAVVALMADLMPGNLIKTFSIGFTEPSYDESPYSRLVASKFTTDHHEDILSAVQAGDLLSDIVARLDEPMSDPSIVPTFLLSEITRRDVTVALGGDGGDELFGGYEYFSGFKLADYYLKLPEHMRRAFLEPLMQRLPISTGYVSPGHVVKKFLSGIRVPAWLRTQMWLGAFSCEQQRLLWNDFPSRFSDPFEIYSSTRELYENFECEKPLNRVFYLFARQYLLDYILVKVDRCSMMNSLEVRAPLLDKELVEFVFALPSHLKIRRWTRKYLLKKALRGLLPERILNRKKRGFLIPTALWLKENLREVREEMLGETRLKQQGLFNPRVVTRMVDEHDSGVADHRKELWTLLVLQLWLDKNPSEIV